MFLNFINISIADDLITKFSVDPRDEDAEEDAEEDPAHDGEPERMNILEDLDSNIGSEDDQVLPVSDDDMEEMPLPPQIDKHSGEPASNYLIDDNDEFDGKEVPVHEFMKLDATEQEAAFERDFEATRELRKFKKDVNRNFQLGLQRLI